MSTVGSGGADLTPPSATEAQDALAAAKVYADAGDAVTLATAEAFTNAAVAPTLVMTGQTPGLGANESVELLGPAGEHLDASFFTADVPVRIEVDAEGAGINVGPNAKITRAMIINRGTAYLDGGALTLDSAGLSAGSGAGATALWTLTLALSNLGDGPPSRVKLTFATGAGNTHKVNVKAEVDFQEGSAFP